MALGKTARRLLPFPKATDAPAVTADIQALATALDNDVEIHQGKLSERPAAALSGRMYLVQGDATPANNGIIWTDNGSTWVAPPSLTFQSYALVEAETVRAASTNFTPNVSRPTLVMLSFLTVSGTIKVSLGAQLLYEAALTSAMLLVPPGVTWKWSGSATACASSYMTL